MPRYIALLRAINVSGARIIKMEDLRKHFAIKGFTNIVTYIQSGNVLFDSEETDQQALETKIEAKLLKVLGYEVTVILRSLDEMAQIAKKDPFKKERKEGDKYYVVFLKETPIKENLKDFMSFANDVDRFKLIGNDLYWLLRPEMGKSVVSSTFLEKKLKVLTTNRNWNTVNKVLAL